MSNEFKARNGVITPFLQSTVATGTAPFTVASTTLVSNLNVQYLNGQAGSYYTNLANMTGSLNVASLTGTLPVANGGTGVTTSTGSGSVVLNTSPSLATSLLTSSTSFDLLNTTATTINFAGASTALNIGSSTATVKIQSINDSTSTTIGSFITSGGVGIAKNINIGGAAFIGANAYTTAFTNPILFAKNSGATYTQAALVNTSSTGSTDWIAYGDNGTDNAGWADIGMTGSAFNDANYTITGKNDGYFFVQGVTGAGLTGNMVLATGGNGTTNDIIFGTGGFLSVNEKMRFVHATGQFYIETTTASTSTSTGALRVAGGAGIAGSLFVGGTVTANAFSGPLTGTASLATSIAGGLANQIHYQSAPGTTAFISAPTTANTSLTWTGSAFAWNAPTSNTTYTKLTTNANLVASGKYIATTSGGSFTLTLPASPSIGDSIIVADGADWSVNPVIIARNGSTIENIADDVSLNIGGISVTLVYDGSTWEVYAQAGAQGGTSVTLSGTQTLSNKTLASPIITGNTTSNGILAFTYTGAGSTGTINIGGYNSKGGTGYHDFLQVTNGYGSATNPNKYFRLNSTGGLEILNSAYSSTLFSISDSGVTTIPGGGTASGGLASANGLNIGTHGGIWDDGNFHISSSSGNVWINANDNSLIALNTQSTGGVSAGGTFSMNSGFGSIATAFGVRAWINCGWNGTSMTIRGAGNLTVTRAGTGVYNFTFNGTNMPDGNYCVTATAMTPSSNSDIAANISYNTTPTTTGFQITTARYGTGNIDVTYLCVQVIR